MRNYDRLGRPNRYPRDPRWREETSTRFVFRGDPEIGAFVEDVCQKVIEQKLERMVQGGDGDSLQMLERIIYRILERNGPPTLEDVRREVMRMLDYYGPPQPPVVSPAITAPRDYSALSDD